MSVYIRIKDASLNQRPSAPMFLLIESSSAVLKTIETPSSKNPFWQSEFICSIRERYLHFRICENTYSNSNMHIPSTSSLQSLIQNKTIAVGELPFQYFDQQPGTQNNMKVELMRQLENGQYNKQGFLHLSVYYDSRKNYIGEMEFYQFGDIAKNNTANYNNQGNNNRAYSNGNNNGYGLNNGFNLMNGAVGQGQVSSFDRNMKVQLNFNENNSKMMSLYKGPCKSKNLFSCCDRPVHDQQYEVVQPHYFDPALHHNHHHQNNY